MITAVTLNPAIDRTVIVNKFNFGEVNRVGSSREDMGGKGINVVRILQSLGTDAKAIGFLGRRNLGHTQALLERDHIPYDVVLVDAATRMNTKLLESSSRMTTDINEAGFKVSDNELIELKALIQSYGLHSDFAVFSGSIPPGFSSSLYQELISLLPPTCKAVLDADGELLLKGLAAHPYLIKPNIHELENALGCSLPTHQDVVSASRKLIAAYQINYVLVSMGGSGSILVTKENALFAAPLKVDVKGTVGAGDSMLAGFVHCLSTNQSDREALACATACGALAVSKEGTEAFSKNEVETLSKQVQIEAIN